MSMLTGRFSRPLCIILLCMVVPFTVQAASIESAQLKRGSLVYTQHCLSCHGEHLQGQDNWRKRNADGKLPAPPHDETGHSWHHADTLLFGMTKFGLVPPYAPANYKSDMPAFENLLSDEDIHAVIAFIKSRWPEKVRKIQDEINNQGLQRSGK